MSSMNTALRRTNTRGRALYPGSPGDYCYSSKILHCCHFSLFFKGQDLFNNMPHTGLRESDRDHHCHDLFSLLLMDTNQGKSSGKIIEEFLVRGSTGFGL
jgi:hypothetical protein